MKRVIQSFAAVTALGLGATAHAVPVTFDLAGGPESSVSITNLQTDCTFFSCGASVALNPVLDSLSRTLSAGESWTFNFFSIDFYGLGSGEGTISASLGFDSPTGAPNANGSASGEFWTAFIFSGGDLSWVNPSNQFSLSDGTTYNVTFKDLHGIDFFSQVNVEAVVTLLQEPSTAVPEPGTLALFGLGLLGAGLAARKRRV